tara:strand:- start:33212 stop:36625 length:3414 start_codon:yes stop_codon:yes gene_type:complete
MVFQYGGGGSNIIGTQEDQFTTTTEITESEVTVTAEDILTQTSDTTNVFQMAYEPDGDSIFGALLPNVYISHITLDAKDASGSELDVNVDFVFKEKIEPDDDSLFTIDQLVSALKLRIVMSTSQDTTQFITNGGIPVKNNLNVIYNQKKLAKYLASSDIVKFSQDNNNIQIKTIGLKEITQANGMNALPDNDTANAFQAALEKEVLSDGTTVYNTPYCAPHFTVGKASGGANPSDLAIFAVTYVDFDEVLEKAGVNSAAQFVNNQKEQFQALGFGSDTASQQTAAIQLETLFEDYGLGIPMKNQVIHHKKVQNSNKEFVYADGPKKGKVWGGLVHYHGQSNPSPDGWVGWMGGTAEHMSNPSIPNPKLQQVNVDMTGQITDLRPLSIVNPFVEPSQQENPNPSPLFSHPHYSIHGNGQSSFIFSFDSDQALRDNTSHPELLSSLKSSNPGKYNNLLQQANITNFVVSRQQVTVIEDEGGLPFDITNIVMSSDNGATLKTSSDSIVKGSGFLGEGLNSSDSSNGSIKEIKLLSSNTGLRHFGVTDASIGNIDEGVFQYSVEIEMKDPVADHISQAYNIISVAKQELQKYEYIIESNKKYYNSQTGMFNTLFAEKYVGVTHPKDVNKAFFSTNLYKSVKSFFDNVVNDFPVLQGNTKEQKMQLQNIVLQQINPLTGNKNGVLTAAKMINNVESELVNMSSHEPSSKDSTSTSDTLDSGLASGPGKEKNIFNLSHAFASLFDSTDDATRGYEYIFSPDSTSGKPSSDPGLAVISLTDFGTRMATEHTAYAIPASFESFPESDSKVSMPSYMSPVSAKISGKSVNIGSNTNEAELQDAFVNIVTYSVDLGSLNMPNTTPPQSAFSPSTPISTSPFGLLGLGTSVEPKGSSRSNGGANTDNPPIDIESASETQDSYNTPPDDTINNITPLLIKTLLIEASGYFTDISFEDHVVFNPDGTFNKSNDVGSFLDKAQSLQGANGGPPLGHVLNAFPNQIKKLLNDIAEAYPNITAGISPIEMSQSIVNQQATKTNFEKNSNLISMLLKHRNLVRVEVLSGYSTTKSDGAQMKDAKFEILDMPKYKELLANAAANTHILARLRPYDDFGMFKQPESMSLPIFNEYFLFNVAQTNTATTTPAPATPR